MDAPYVANARLGTVLFSSEKSPLWYKVQYTVPDGTRTGWIASSTVSELSGADRRAVYQQIVEKNSDIGGDFMSSSSLAYFLKRVSGEMPADQGAELELKRAMAMRSALSKISRSDRNVSPYADFLRDHDSELVYNPASGEYLVSSTLFWNLAERMRRSSKGDEVAWTAARNPLSSDCSAALNCYLFNLRMTDGEYLSWYPSGMRSSDAVRNLSAMLEPMAGDLKDQALFKGPAEADAKAELASIVTELRTIVARSSSSEKDRVLGLLSKIGEAYK